MTTTIKIQARGVLTLPKKLRTRMNFVAGSIVQVKERGGGIFIAPASSFDKELSEDIRRSLKEFEKGNYIEFSKKKEEKVGPPIAHTHDYYTCGLRGRAVRKITGCVAKGC
jgi:AbrB family looped-hinge helix DNA binding protein